MELQDIKCFFQIWNTSYVKLETKLLDKIVYGK